MPQFRRIGLAALAILTFALPASAASEEELDRLFAAIGTPRLMEIMRVEGLEQAEKRMGWSARSGKIVLRIALQRLKRHFDDLGDAGGMIG